MSPVESQAVCMGCLVNPPYNPHNPYFAPLYSPMHEQWPTESWFRPKPIQLEPPSFQSSLPEAVLTEDEKEVLALLATAWNKFNDLDTKHPSDNSEFVDSIHRAQQIVALRVARRANPEVWSLGQPSPKVPGP